MMRNMTYRNLMAVIRKIEAKSYLGEQAMREYGDELLHTKIFIEFVALIIRNKIYTCLKERMKELKKKKNYMTVPLFSKKSRVNTQKIYEHHLFLRKK